jgi:two-component system, sensor histidine kinase and response regulator
LQQAEMIGLLYLESRLFTHAFTPEHLLAIELLASQAATSLGNAQLYADLQQENNERRRAEQAWHASEKTLHQLVDILPIAVYSCAADGRIESYNRRAVELWGREPRLGDQHELFSGAFRLFNLDGSELPHAQSPMAEVLRSGQAQTDREIVVEREDGTRRIVMVNPVPRRDAQGNLTGAINCVTDITDRKHAEDALSASRAMFRSLFDSAPDAILVVDPVSGQIIRSNRQATALFGYDGEELLGQSVEILLPERFRSRHPRLRSAYLAHPHARPLGTGIELFGRRKDGSEFPVDITLGTLETGEGVLALSIVRDISERKQAEAEHRARLATEAAIRAKSEFLANMSHELRSPLNTILGFARLMASDPGLPNTARDDLELILRSGEHLYALINQVLDLSKLEAGRATFNTADFDLHLLLDDVRSLFLPPASSKGLQLLFARHRKVPRRVQGDPLKLRQVLINLIDNAIKFTVKGGVSLNVAPAEMDGSEDGQVPKRIVFRVTDSGPGIVAAELEQLFQAFVQAEAGRQAQHGTGLGLAISRGLVQLMGGQMTMDSEVGRGTTVRFEIPLQPAVSQKPAAEARFARVLGLAHGQPRYRVLIVDDQAEARELLVRLLAPLGFVVKEAADGLAAVNTALAWRPDAVLMDLTMPELDGYEATRRIRADPNCRRCIVLAITAGGGETERAAALAAGCDDVLRKPLREADLFAALERYLKVHFIVEEEAQPALPALDPEALRKLPEAQLAALEEALVHLDSDAVERSINMIRNSDVEIAQTLAAFAKEFQYDSILLALHGLARRANDAAGAGSLGSSKD